MINEELSARISLVGDVLAPFFLQDPRTGDAQACFDALATLDVQTASLEWPFVEAAEARADLGAMQASLREKDTAVSADAAVISDEMMWSIADCLLGQGRNLRRHGVRSTPIMSALCLAKAHLRFVLGCVLMELSA